MKTISDSQIQDSPLVGGSVLRPQARIEADLQAGDRDHVRPGFAGEDGVDDGVGDTGGCGGRPQRPAVDRLAECDGELTGDLGNGVGAGHVWPVGTELPGLVPGGTGHAVNVGAHVVRGEDRVQGPRSTHRDHVSNYERKSSAGYVTGRIMSFEAKELGDRWSEVAAMVREVVMLAYADSGNVDDLLTTTAGYVGWCHKMGLPMDRAALFTRRQVEDYITNNGRNWKPATKGTIRSKLLRVCEALGDTDDTKLSPLPQSDPQAPYSDAEVHRYVVWADEQTTEKKRHATLALLALGFGAGLTAGEVARVRLEDVIVDDDGMLVHVDGGERGRRLVPVLVEWEDTLARVLATVEPGQFVFRPDRAKAGKNTVTEFVAKNTQPEVHFQSQRVRATWIVRHLRAGTPLQALLDPAGVKDIEAFGRYVKFLPQVDRASGRSLLRFASERIGAVR